MRLFLVVFFCFAHFCYAQDCSLFYFFQKGKTIELTTFSKKGEPNGKRISKVLEINQTGNNIKGTIYTEMLDKKGKVYISDTTYCTCEEGSYFIDVKMLMPQQQGEQFKNAQATTTDAKIEYPAKFAIGDKLKDGLLKMKLDLGGLVQNITLEIKDRNVEKQESVTTDAGSWEAFKINAVYHFLVEANGISIPMKMEMTEWFVPNFGVVKSESKYGTSLLTLIK